MPGVAARRRTKEPVCPRSYPCERQACKSSYAVGCLAGTDEPIDEDRLCDLAELRRLSVDEVREQLPVAQREVTKRENGLLPCIEAAGNTDHIQVSE